MVKMNIRRFFRHLAMTPWRVRRALSPAALASIEALIAASESAHGGEIRFAVEGALHPLALLRGQGARERAIEIFSRLRIWDTEDNNGVLIYLLLADRDVEIVADRGIASRVGRSEWEAICRRMEAALGQGKFEIGLCLGIEAVSERLAAHFPAHRGRGSELPDRPVLL